MNLKTKLSIAVVSFGLIVGTASADDHKTGIEECDKYYEKIMGCFDEKLPADQRDAIKQQYEASFAAWKDAAKDESSRAALADACAQAETTAAQSFSAMGCEF